MISRTPKLMVQISSGFLALVLVAGGLYIPSQSVNAQWTVIDPANLTVNTITSVNTTAQSAGVSPKNILDALAWTVAKVAIQSITRSTVNWINSGFQGSPAFVSDLRQNLSYLGDSIADDFFTHLDQEVISSTGFTIKSPFQDQINQKLRNEFYRTTASYGVNQYYTLYQDSPDPKAFIEQGKFSQGGFNAWFSASQNPANNPFGAYTLANSQLWSQIDAASKAREAELGWSKGFLPWRGNCGTPASGGNVSLTQKDNCLFSAVKTPGSVIESSLENSLGTGIRQLELADSINEIVASLVGQMVSQVLGSGGLTGLSQPAPGGGQTYVNTATNPNQYSSSNQSAAAGIVQDIKNIQQTITTFRTNWQTVLDAATNAERACGIRNDITTVITQATNSVTRANASLDSSDVVLAEVQNAMNSSITDITAAATDYQSYLASGNIPNTAEQAEAAAQSADTTNVRNGQPSLYTQMKDAASTCSRGRV